MALATRCPYCQTTFRVVHDQLKLRSGIVRCGQCQHIFNGIEHLVRAATPASTVTTSPAPVETIPSGAIAKTATTEAVTESAAAAPVETAAIVTSSGETANIATPPVDSAKVNTPDESAMPPWQDTEVHPAFANTLASEASAADAWTAPETAPETAPSAAPDGDEPAPDMPAAADDVPAAAQHLPETLPTSPANRHPAQPHHSSERIEPTLNDDARPENRHTLDVARAVESLANHAASSMPAPDGEPVPDQAATETALDDADEPNFVKSGRRQQKWQRVWFWLQSFSLLILLLLLLTQAIYTWRDVIATRWPVTKPHLLQACALLHCKVELPTQIHMLSIELGELQALPRNKNTFSYATLLRNHSNLVQSWPGIELVLLDANDHVVARRIFSPQEYQIPPQERSKGFAAQSEQPIKLYFETAPQLKALGYRAEIFYP